jgi:hypothetical protein
MEIGLPHWAQGFPRGKLPNSARAMAHLPFIFYGFEANWTDLLTDHRRDRPSHIVVADF